jgi:hypothetical protein
MPSLVPILFFVIILLVFQNSDFGTSWRASFLVTALVWGISLTAMTELLSLFRLIEFWSIFALWTLSCSVALIYLMRAGYKPGWSGIRASLTSLSRSEPVLLTGMALIITGVGITACISPPNNWDSMTYHMSRVVHWIQNGSIEHYPTSITRQLYLNPWAEFAILHFQILSGSDRFANLIQWFSMLGSTLGVSLLARQLGAGPHAQIFSALVCVTIPMGILQGSSTQNDYVVSFWLVCFTYFSILLRENGKPLYALAVGASLGLAILTKGTAYIYALSFLIWIGISLFKTHRRERIQSIAIIVMAVMIINFGHFSRNHTLYGNPFGPVQNMFANQVLSASSLTSNIIRNIALHISTPFGPVNAILEKEIYRLHETIGVDPNDPRSTWKGREFHVTGLSRHEDIGGNPLHLVLIGASTLIFLFGSIKQKNIACFLACLMGGTVFFSLYLKWQPWNSRLHLPLFILWAPITGTLFSQIGNSRITHLCSVILLLGALPYLLNNQSRPLTGEDSILIADRTQMYFRNRPLLTQPYIDTMQYILENRCSEIGLVLEEGDWEYPLWVLKEQGHTQTIRIEHVHVANASQVKSSEHPYDAFAPCAVIVLGSLSPEKLQVSNVTFLRKMISPPVSVYMQN